MGAALVAAWIFAAPATDGAAGPRGFDGERAVVGDTDAAVPSPAAAPPVTAPPAGTTPVAAAPAVATPAAAPAAKPVRRPARLVIAGGPIIGPHAFGNEECRAEEQRCETHGTFFGLGVNLELRAQLWRPLYVHMRGIFVGNVSPRDPVHTGLYGGGIGLGAYARRAFARAEYLLVDTFGDNRFARPFGSGEVGRDHWSHHAGLFSAGLRLPFRQRFAGELWGGLMVGPRSARTIPDEAVDRRTLLTFLIGLNFAYDLVPAKLR